MPIVELGDICEFLDYRRKPVSEEFRKSGPYPYYGANGQQGWIDSYIFDEPLVLLAEDGGHFGSMTKSIAYKISGKTWVNNHAHVLRPGAQCDIDYLTHALSFYDVSKLIGGTTRPKLTKGNAEAIKLPLPDLSEQKQIAARLEQADRLRRTRRYALELSDTFLRAAFIALFGDLNTNTKGWKSIAFDEVCAIDAPLVDPKKLEYRNLPHIGGDNIESVTGRIVSFRTAAEDGLISSKFLVGPDHILFSKIRPKLRKVSEPRMVALCSADIYPIRTRSNALSPSYLAGFLRSEYFTRIVSSLAESRTNIPKVNREELSDIPVLLPPITEQEKFAALAKRRDRMRARQREALRQAEHMFQSLRHCAFTAGV